MHRKVETKIGERTLVIETGKMARQAAGSVVLTYGDTVVFAAVAYGKDVKGLDFFPMTIDYREKTYAAGKIPGGFFKREGRPTNNEIMTMRMIDRPIRPLFPKGYRREVVITTFVMSSDPNDEADVLALIASGTALALSGLPCKGPAAGIRVGRIDGKLISNPTTSQIEEGDLDLVVAATEDAILMVESSARELSEDDMVDAILFGHEQIKQIISMQNRLVEEVAPEPIPLEEKEEDPALLETILGEALEEAKRRHNLQGKHIRSGALKELKKELIDKHATVDGELDPVKASATGEAFNKMMRGVLRRQILETGKRHDGRATDEVREITCEVGLLPRTHGSALFTRGETQSLVITTLGSTLDEQVVDGLKDEYTKKFMLHYNFPSFCVGETWPNRGPRRREIGHGMLAERAVNEVLPDWEDFPYTIRVVSDVLESNGSSSMATVCGATLALMDAGVKIRRPVAGIAMGLVKEGDKVAVLSDISGSEDADGDMDFKVAGTQNGVTALQMDIKIAGITDQIMRQALAQAREGRKHILQVMLKQTLMAPREELSPYAPRHLSIKINPEKIGAIIGPGGKTIRRLQEETGATIDVEDDGTVLIYTPNGESLRKAKEEIEKLTEEAVIGKVYDGRVVSVKDFGAFVEIIPGQEGLVHISELAAGFVGKVSDVVQINDRLDVKVIDIDGQGRIKLSHKATLN
ncbi:MAG: polyribonucleotide nucleotidyltransferase [Planctomycetota bacterium]|nr:polyribonucleotide nucleotidyltransferase [Planctomycetota bacterium]